MLFINPAHISEIARIKRTLKKVKDAGWAEWLHPRKNNGEFTEAGSGGATSENKETGNSAPLRAPKQALQPGTKHASFPVLNLPDDKIAKLKEESFRRAVKHEGPKPVEKEIPITSLASFQELVETNKVKAIAKKYKSEQELSTISDKPRVFKYGNKYIITNGNHRANAALMNGHSKLTVSYLGDFTDLV